MQEKKMSSTSAAPLNEFFRELLAFESGLDPHLFEWYVQNQFCPVISYWRVESCGRIFRDWDTGKPIQDLITVARYFEILGVSELFNVHRVSCITDMQYRAMNPWGFFGYQLGEGILIDLGYYEPEMVSSSTHGPGLPSYYVGPVDAVTWSQGVRVRPLLSNADKKNGLWQPT
jgi:hypothetical protein